MKRIFLTFSLLCAAMLAVGCVDSPQEPSASPDSPLASTFDALSRDAATNGDNARGTEFAWAAVAIAAGMTPSRLIVNNSGRSETYEAFVHATTISAPNVTDGLTTRTLIAWRKPANVLQVIMLSAPDNVSNVLHPASMGPINNSNAPFRGAHAAYYERADNASLKTWIGVGGSVKLTDGNIGTQPCEVALPVTSGVSCVRARFSVTFDIRLAAISPGAMTPSANADRTLRAAEHAINGLKLAVRCVTPSLQAKGCVTSAGRSR
ncbi:MAG TPA: hypothetical protein VJ717_06855 [Gemmatimonadaceae bacterium]|nr:hypothetical protein [Gemmatimonadaceae bacterium]